jgi:hypothetical protein
MEETNTKITDRENVARYRVVEVDLTEDETKEWNLTKNRRLDELRELIQHAEGAIPIAKADIKEIQKQKAPKTKLEQIVIGPESPDYKFGTKLPTVGVPLKVVSPSAIKDAD